MSSKRFGKSRYMDPTYVPKIGDEMEWGLNNKEHVYEANCGRHEVVSFTEANTIVFKHLSGPGHNATKCQIHLGNAWAVSSFEWYPVINKPIILLQED